MHQNYCWCCCCCTCIKLLRQLMNWVVMQFDVLKVSNNFFSLLLLLWRCFCFCFCITNGQTQNVSQFSHAVILLFTKSPFKLAVWMKEWLNEWMKWVSEIMFTCPYSLTWFFSCCCCCYCYCCCCYFDIFIVINNVVSINMIIVSQSVSKTCMSTSHAQNKMKKKIEKKEKKKERKKTE